MPHVFQDTPNSSWPKDTTLANFVWGNALLPSGRWINKWFSEKKTLFFASVVCAD